MSIHGLFALLITVLGGPMILITYLGYGNHEASSLGVYPYL